MLMTLPLHPHAHTPQPHFVSPCSGHLTSRASSPRERRSLSAYLSHSHSPAVSSSSAYSPSPSRSPLLVCTLASDLRGGRLHVTWSDSRLASGAAAAGCLLHVISRPRHRPSAIGPRPSVAMATREYVSVRTHAHAPSHSILTTRDLSDADQSNQSMLMTLQLHRHTCSHSTTTHIVPPCGGHLTSHHVPQASPASVPKR